jgi:hypothetical protein
MKTYGGEYRLCIELKTKLNPVAWVRQRIIPTERPPLVGEDSVCRVISATDPYRRILGILDRTRYYFFQAAPQLYSRGWVHPVPDPLLRKSGSAGESKPDLWSVARNFDH